MPARFSMDGEDNIFIGFKNPPLGNRFGWYYIGKNLAVNIGGRYISKPYVFSIDVICIFVNVSILSISVPGQSLNSGYVTEVDTHSIESR